MMKFREFYNGAMYVDGLPNTDEVMLTSPLTVFLNGQPCQQQDLKKGDVIETEGRPVRVIRATRKV